MQHVTSGRDEMTKPTIRRPWLFYHGATTLRLAQIRQGNALLVSKTSDKKVALTGSLNDGNTPGAA
jgi:hypothetical protein